MSIWLKSDICSLEDWLLSLSNMHLEFLHVFSGLIFSFLFTTTLCFPEWLSQLIHEYYWWMASWLFSTSENYTQSGSEHSCLDLCLDFRFQLGDYWSNLVFSYEGNATLVYIVYTSLDSHYRPSHCTFQPTCTTVSSMGISHSKKCSVSPCLLSAILYWHTMLTWVFQPVTLLRHQRLQNFIHFLIKLCFTLKFLSYFQYMCFIWCKIPSPRLYLSSTCNFANKIQAFNSYNEITKLFHLCYTFIWDPYWPQD